MLFRSVAAQPEGSRGGRGKGHPLPFPMRPSGRTRGHTGCSQLRACRWASPRRAAGLRHSSPCGKVGQGPSPGAGGTGLQAGLNGVITSCRELDRAQLDCACLDRAQLDCARLDRARLDRAQLDHMCLGHAPWTVQPQLCTSGPCNLHCAHLDHTPLDHAPQESDSGRRALPEEGNALHCPPT